MREAASVASNFKVRPCPHCGAPFTPPRARQSYCSRACWHSAISGRARDLSNQRFHRVLVLRRAANDKNRRIMWHCRCDCGTEWTVRGAHLTSGRIKSCNCRKRDIAQQFIKDLVGKTFHRLTVLRQQAGSKRNSTYSGPDWVCECACGNIVTVPGSFLRDGITLSCGCLKRENGIRLGTAHSGKLDLTGHVFGWLTVERTFAKDKANNMIWECRCRCGNIKRVKATRLASGSIVSCGCRKPNKKTPLMPEDHRLDKRRKEHARRAAGGSFSGSQIAELMTKQRHLCANPSCKKSIRKHYHIDHIQPIKLGGCSDISNIQILCVSCNTSKGAKDPFTWANGQGRLL